MNEPMTSFIAWHCRTCPRVHNAPTVRGVPDWTLPAGWTHGPAPLSPLPLPPVVPIVVLAATKKEPRPWGIRLLLWLLGRFTRA